MHQVTTASEGAASHDEHEPLASRPDRWPALDGLRAVAVYLVVAFHAGVGRFEGGFIGVDVFFVLSGFLITRLLVVEHETSGRLDLPAFYARRARRLLPAAWVAIIGTAAIYVLVATPFERETVVRDARASVFYVANWNFIDRSQDYFAESISSSPFLHLWSLAVEEQFYLLWPVCMLAVLALRQRSGSAATALVAAGSLVGAVAALRVADGNLLRAYYGTDTRAYQLLFGAVIALIVTGRTFRWPVRVSRTVATWLVAGGVVGIIVTATAFDVDPVERGLLAASATIVAIVGVIAPTNEVSAPSQVLGSRPLVWLGQRSYATYLWHWPLVVALERVFVIGPRLTVVIVALTATGLAHLSMDLVERPIRLRSARADRREDLVTIGAALAITVLMGTVVVAAVLRSDVEPLRAADRVGFTTASVDGTEFATAPVATVPETGPTPPSATTPTRPSPPDSVPPDSVPPDSAPPDSDPAGPISVATEPFVPETVPLRVEELLPIRVPEDLGGVPIDSAFSERDGCPNDVPDTVGECIVVSGDGGERVLLIGDSHAGRLKIALAEHATATDGTFAAFTMNGCPWQDGLLYVDALSLEAAKQFCRDQRDVLYDELLEEFAPDVVILAAHDQTTEGFAVEARPERSVDAGLTGLDLIEAATIQTFDRLAAPGRRIVVVEPLPNSPFHAVNCLSAAEFVDDCAFLVPDWPHLETAVFRRLAGERPDVITTDLSTLVCPNFPICRPIIDGVQVRTDADHLYEAFVLRIGPEMIRLVGLS